MKWNIILLAAVLAVSGCAYSTTPRTAKGIKSVSVPFFENLTSEPDLELTVTERIIQNLLDDNTLNVADESNADAVLEGKIRSFENVPFSFNRELNAEEYHVIVTVEATLYNRRLNQPIWENETFRGDGSYFLDLAEGGFSFEDALEEAISEITERILNLTVQDW